MRDVEEEEARRRAVEVGKEGGRRGGREGRRNMHQRP